MYDNSLHSNALSLTVLASRARSAVRAGQKWSGRVLTYLGRPRDRCPFREDSELHYEVQQHGHRLSVLHGRVKFCSADGYDGVLVEPKTDGPRNRDLSRLSVDVNHYVIERHSGYAVILRKFV
jgi:hypothetical protein